MANWDWFDWKYDQPWDLGAFESFSNKSYIYIYMVGGLDHVLFFHTLGIIIATDSTDELIFFRGVDIPPTRYF